MNEFLNSWSPRALSVLRIITGFLFLWHGSQKLFNFPPMPPMPPGTEPPPFAFLAFAGGLEFFGGLLILIGLFTRWTAFILSGMMAVAYWMAHGTNGKGFLPLMNGGELAVIYCFVFLYLFFAGGGSWSVDGLFKKESVNSGRMPLIPTAFGFKEMKEYIEKAMTFAEYIKLIDDLLLDGKTTGTNQSEAMVGYGKLNRQRMHRLEKTVVLNESLREKVQNNKRKMIWLIITEGWCGDAAQNIPVIEKIAAESSLIETRYVLRDENLELMDAYLTNNARSIPKLIALDAETLQELGTWGPRPAAAMDLFSELRNSGLEKSLILEKVQRWYLADKNQTIQAEFEKLLEDWKEPKEVAAKI